MADFRKNKSLSDAVDRIARQTSILDNPAVSRSVSRTIDRINFPEQGMNNPFGSFSRPSPIFGPDAFKREFLRSSVPVAAPFLTPDFQEEVMFSAKGSGAFATAGSIVGSLIPTALALLYPPSSPVVFAAMSGAASSEDFIENENVASAIGAGLVEAISEVTGTKLIGKIGTGLAGDIGRAILKSDARTAKVIVAKSLAESGVEGTEESISLVLDSFIKVGAGVLSTEQAVSRIASELPMAFAGGFIGGTLLTPISVLSPAARSRFRSSMSQKQAIAAQTINLSQELKDKAVNEIDLIIRESNSGDPGSIKLTDEQVQVADFLRSMIVEESSGTQAGLDEARRVSKAERRQSEVVEDSDLSSESAVNEIFSDQTKTIGQKVRSIVLTESQELQAQIREERQFARQAIQTTRVEERARSRETVARIREDVRQNEKTVESIQSDIRDAVRSSQLPSAVKNQILARSSTQAKTRAGLDRVLDAIDVEQSKVDLKESQASLKKTIARARKVKKAGPESRALLDSFVSMFDTSKPTKKTKSRLKGLQEFVDANPDALIPQKVVDRLKRLEKKPVADLTEQEARDADEIISQIVHNINTKNRLLTARGERDFEQTVTDIQQEMSQVLKRRRELPSGGLAKEPGDNIAKLIFGLEETSSIDTMAEFLGGSENSKTHDVLFGNIDQDNQAKYDAFYKNEDLWEASIKGAGLDLNSNRLKSMSPALARTNLFRSAVNRERITTATTHTFELASGKKVKMFKSQMMHLAASLQDQQTRELVVLRGTPVVPQGQSVDNAFVMTRADEANLNNSLSPEERVIVKSFVEILNGPMKDSYREYSIRKFGFDKTQPGRWVSRHRVKLGGKVQEITASNATQVSEDQLSINKDRTEDTRLPIEIRDVFVEFQNLNWTISSLRHLSFSIDSARRVLADERIAKQIKESTRGQRASDRFTAQYDNVVKSFAGRGLTPRVSIDNVSRRTILNVNKSLLAFSPTVPFYQPVSVINASFEIPARFLTQATIEGSALNLGIEKRMSESGAIRFRSDGSVYSKVSQGLGPSGSRLLGVKTRGEKGLALIRTMDQMAIRTIWRAAELQAASEVKAGRLKESDQLARVKSIAQRTINRTQPTGDPLYTTGVVAQRADSVLAAGFGAFRAQTSKTMDMVYREWARAPRTRFGRSQALVKTSLLIFGTSMAVASIEEAIKLAARGFKKDPKDDRGSLKRIFQKGASRAVGIPLFGSFLWPIFMGISRITTSTAIGVEDPFEGQRIFDPSFSPAASTIADLSTSPLRIAALIASDDAQAEQWIDATTDMAGLISSIYGVPLVVPIREIKKLHKNLSDQDSGKILAR